MCNRNKVDPKYMFYAYNPLKNTVLGFSDEKVRDIYAAMDPQQFGDVKDGQRRQAISLEQKDNLVKNKKSTFSIMSDNYANLIKKITEETKADKHDYLRFKRAGFNTVGVVVRITNNQIKELEEENLEIFKQYAVALNKKESYDNRMINIAKMNGNYIPFYKDFNAKKFYKKMLIAMHPKNFVKLNPDYNKFAVLLSKKNKNQQVFRFSSVVRRIRFIDNINKIAKTNNEDIRANYISSFNAITTFKCSTNQVINMYKKGIKTQELKNIIASHGESTQFKKRKAKKLSLSQKRNQTRTR